MMSLISEFAARIITISVVVLMCYPVTNAHAQDAGAVMERIRGALEDAKKISIRYTRSFDRGEAGGSRTSMGSLHLKDMDKFRIETESQTIVSDGETVWTYTAARRQVIIDKVMKRSKIKTPRDFIYDYLEEYDLKLLEEDKFEGEYALELTPVFNENFIKSVRIWVDAEDYLPRKVVLVDVNGNTTTWEALEILLDPDFEKSFFSYFPSPDVDVVDFR